MKIQAKCLTNFHDDMSVGFSEYYNENYESVVDKYEEEYDKRGGNSESGSEE